VPATPSCVFCEQAGSSTEHVFAQWIGEALDGYGPFNLKRSGGRSKSETKTIAVTTRAACEPCNNAWMSRLEEAVKPILTPMITGNPARWTRAADQIVIARWAFKTGLMFDRSSRPPDVSPPEHCAYLYREGVPPSSVTITLGRYAPTPGEEAVSVGVGAARLAVDDARLPADLGAYRIMFSVGHVIFQVYGYRGTDTRDYEVERSLTIERDGVETPVADAFRQLWPLTLQPFEWPPRGAQFDTSGLRLLEPLP
jgi:hypothetical protein